MKRTRFEAQLQNSSQMGSRPKHENKYSSPDKMGRLQPFYNCLLGRPWIHIAGVVPSNLHQKIKFVIKGQLVCIVVEKDMIVATSLGAPQVEVDEKTMQCFFRSLEFVNAMYVGEGAKVPVPKLSKNSYSGIR